MKQQILILLSAIILALSCQGNDNDQNKTYSNPTLPLEIPPGFPSFNAFVVKNKPTKYGVELGKKLFHDSRLSTNNTISCATCHSANHAFANPHAQAIGIYGRIGLRNAPSIQNLAFMQVFNWDGNIRQLEKQALVPIITHEEMNSSIVTVMNKIKDDSVYQSLFQKSFGNDSINPDRIYRSLAQYQYTLISANSKYDKVQRQEGPTFTPAESRGHALFQQKCSSCHSGELFTDQSFRNIGFPLNPNPEEIGRARVTRKTEDYMRFRVPSLRNIAFTAPYGSFGQFSTLQAVLDYFDKGVLSMDNLDPLLKTNGNRIPMTSQQKKDMIAFLHTLSDYSFIKQ